MNKFDMYNFRADEREIQFMNLKHENWAPFQKLHLSLNWFYNKY